MNRPRGTALCRRQRMHAGVAGPSRSVVGSSRPVSAVLQLHHVNERSLGLDLQSQRRKQIEL